MLSLAKEWDGEGQVQGQVYMEGAGGESGDVIKGESETLFLPIPAAGHNGGIDSLAAGRVRLAPRAQVEFL